MACVGFRGYLYLQKTRKSGGTTLCGILVRNTVVCTTANMHWWVLFLNIQYSFARATTKAAESIIIASGGGKCSHVRPIGPYLQWHFSSRIMLWFGDTFFLARTSSNANRFQNFTEMQQSLIDLGGEMMESEDGELPKFIDGALSRRKKWTFITIMRYPLDRLLSSVKYDLLKSHQNTPDRGTLFKSALYLMNISIKKCKSRNYYTRVFSHTCRYVVCQGLPKRCHWWHNCMLNHL